MKKISLSLDEKSITAAIKEVEKYKAWVQKKSEMLCERLALIGAKEASVRFTTAMYDGDNNVEVEAVPIENGWAVVAKGERTMGADGEKPSALFFIEFGSGVYHNTAEPYPNPRPEGIVGIGEYGKGYGKRRGWVYYDENKNKVFTRGNPAAMPMWYASQEMLNSVTQIAKEVFRHYT